MLPSFKNRTDAGQKLAQRLMDCTIAPDALVLALPRGGVPVAAEIARALHAPLDVCLVRKLGVPGQPELAMGAIGMHGVRILNSEVTHSRSISSEQIEAVTRQEQQELARRDRLYRGDRPLPALQDRQIILVDDGIATGSTMRAAIATLKPQQPKHILVAVPIAPAATCHTLRAVADEVVSLFMPQSFYAIGHWYEDFTQTTDAEVRHLLDTASNSAIA